MIYQELHYRENQPFHPQQLRNANSSWARSGLCAQRPSSCWDLVWLGFSRSCVCHHNCCAFLLHSFPAVSRTQLLPYSHLSPLALASFLPCLLQQPLSLWRGCSVCVPFGDEQPAVSSSLFPGWLRVSVLVTEGCKQSFPDEA